MIFILLILSLALIAYFILTTKKDNTNTPAINTKVETPVDKPHSENGVEGSSSHTATQDEPEKRSNDIAICQPSSIITTGENEYYKKLLQDNRWIQKSNRRKEMDHYICQNCHNTIKLDNINEISKYVDFPEVANIVISVFNQENSLQQNNAENLEEQSYNIYKIKEKTDYIPKYNIYLNRYHLGLFSFCQHWRTIALASTIYIISSKNLSDNDIDSVSFKSIKCAPFKTKTKQGYSNNDTIFVQYMESNTTNDIIYLTFCFNYITGVDYNKGIGMLTKNNFAIIFPLYRLNCSDNLEVHHKKYSRSHLPWDVKYEDLITLCHSCHMEANKKPIPIE